jgi:hypothetical protein
MLCSDHKSACVLADGASLDATLALAKPADGPLEGSSLGWLYNPVFVVDSARLRHRGWTSFAGGGMAVLEDRFEAQDAFAFWMCERAEMVELLTDLSTQGYDSSAVLKNSFRPRLLMAYDMWVWSRAIEEKRAALGRWPASFEELRDILSVPKSMGSPNQHDEAAFLAILAPIAKRRLSSSRAPA